MGIPQVAETHTPQPMDAAGECSLYAVSILGILSESSKLQKLRSEYELWKCESVS